MKLMEHESKAVVYYQDCVGDSRFSEKRWQLRRAFQHQGVVSRRVNLRPKTQAPNDWFKMPEVSNSMIGRAWFFGRQRSISKAAHAYATRHFPLRQSGF
jgi:hypothetical protein